MKICTLVVRLLGIYLIVTAVIAIIEARGISSTINIAGVTVGGLVEGPVNRMYAYAALGLSAGLTCTLFAARVARLLTFDELEN